MQASSYENCRRMVYHKPQMLYLRLFIIILIVPVDVHTCESASVSKHWNIKNIQLGQQNPRPGKYHRKINMFCEARTIFEHCFFE